MKSVEEQKGTDNNPIVSLGEQTFLTVLRCSKRFVFTLKNKHLQRTEKE